MPTKTLAPSRLNKLGQLWRDDRPFAEALGDAINQFRLKYGVLPVSAYCGDPIPTDFEADGAPIYHDGTVGVHCYWLEFPPWMDGRAASGR